ncbi:MAG TPA: hypothetical protein VFP63_01540 [Dehalococcoidia bacterium]|nr:hypothetical protein [Dehalococcoidia bacterium]
MTLRRFTVGALVFAVLVLGGGTVDRADAAGEPFQELWGDLNCSGEVQSVDALYPLRYVAGIDVYIPEGICDTRLGMFPDTVLQIEGGPQVQWADVDCSGEITAVDALRILRFVAGLPNAVPEGCPAIGELTTLSFAQ